MAERTEPEGRPTPGCDGGPALHSARGGENQESEQMDVKGARALADRLAEARYAADSDVTKAADRHTSSASEVAELQENVAKDEPVPLDAWLGRSPL